ncbi:MAG: SDR family oxidoreductase, partial [bacterium]|nr:SDR family oxidoreductase [bacterium]
MDFLELKGKSIVVFGVANRKSVAWHIAKTLTEVGAEVVYVVRSEARKQSLTKLLGDAPVFVCDVEFEDQVARVRDEIAASHSKIDGLVHSIAFADYEGGIKPFHETGKKQFLRTMDISCYSFIAVANAFRDLLSESASVVTISISTT